jgi:hypothetical protein
MPIFDEMYASDPYFHDISDGSISFQVFEQVAPVALQVPNVGFPVVRADWFVTKTLSSIEGGKYLELRGLVDNEASSLSRFGVFEDTAVLVDGDRRVGMFRSSVTGKARSVMALHTFIGYAWITEDIFDEDVDETRHPIYNLMENEYRGREIIAEMPNGLHVFMITDDTGKILREAPPELVTDHRVPAPNTSRLQAGAISCIRCHAEDSGLRTCVNDVTKLLAGPLSLVGDQVFVDDVTTRYAGRRFDRTISLGRENYEAAVDQLTGGELDVPELSLLTANVYAQYRYEMVDAAVALKELGFDISGVDPFIDTKLILREVLSFDAASFDTFILEDPAIAALIEGVPIRRSDFDRIHARLAYRSAFAREGLTQDFRRVE